MVFRAVSTAFLTSVTPFSAIFSISLCAFFRSSGRTTLFNSIVRKRFCITPLAFLTPTFAVSPALLAAANARSLDSLVGGGMGIFSWEALCASGCGCKFRSFELWIADTMGLTCYHPVRTLAHYPSPHEERHSHPSPQQAPSSSSLPSGAPAPNRPIAP